MLGAIAGDIIGSPYEAFPIKTTRFPLFTEHSRFTDDTVLTVAVAEAILTGTDWAHALRNYARRYPYAGYGENFGWWAWSESSAPYGSWGNGSAMRVSPVGFAYDTLDGVFEQASSSAAVTHDHPEGIKGAQATAATIFLARSGKTRNEIQTYVQDTFGYDLSRSLAEIRPSYRFDVSCQGTVPPAIRAFLESNDFEDAIRNAVSLGGDSDTLACITGGIAQAFYGGVPVWIRAETYACLDEPLIQALEQFEAKYC